MEKKKRWKRKERRKRCTTKIVRKLNRRGIIIKLKKKEKIYTKREKKIKLKTKHRWKGRNKKRTMKEDDREDKGRMQGTWKKKDDAVKKEKKGGDEKSTSSVATSWILSTNFWIKCNFVEPYVDNQVEHKICGFFFLWIYHCTLIFLWKFNIL